MTEQVSDTTEEWAIVELMGRVSAAGRIREVDRYGIKLMRLDIPDNRGGIAATQLIGGAALYRVTMTTEKVARRFAAIDTGMTSWEPAWWVSSPDTDLPF